MNNMVNTVTVIGTSASVAFLIRTYSEFFAAERGRLRERNRIFDRVVMDNHVIIREEDAFVIVD